MNEEKEISHKYRADLISEVPLLFSHPLSLLLTELLFFFKQVMVGQLPLFCYYLVILTTSLRQIDNNKINMGLLNNN
jgi:hypothetical protein